MTDEVKFTDEQWDRVAAAAETFAAALEHERAKLVHVLSKNWAGQCLEGEGVVANLKDLIRGPNASFSSAISTESAYLRSLAIHCAQSKAALESADEESAERFAN